MGSLVGAAGPVWLSARPCLVRRLLASGWQDKVTRWLAAEPRVVPDLVLTVGQSLVLAQIDGCGTRVPGASVGLLVDGSCF